MQPPVALALLHMVPAAAVAQTEPCGARDTTRRPLSRACSTTASVTTCSERQQQQWAAPQVLDPQSAAGASARGTQQSSVWCRSAAPVGWWGMRPPSARGEGMSDGPSSSSSSRWGRPLASQQGMLGPMQHTRSSLAHRIVSSSSSSRRLHAGGDPTQPQLQLLQQVLMAHQRAQQGPRRAHQRQRQQQQQQVVEQQQQQQDRAQQAPAPRRRQLTSPLRSLLP